MSTVIRCTHGNVVNEGAPKTLRCPYGCTETSEGVAGVGGNPAMASGIAPAPSRPGEARDGRAPQRECSCSPYEYCASDDCHGATAVDYNNPRGCTDCADVGPYEAENGPDTCQVCGRDVP